MNLTAHGASLGLMTILKGAKCSISWVLLVYHQWDLQVRDNSANRKAWIPWAEKWYPLMPGYIWCVQYMWWCYWVSLLYKLCRAVLEPIYTAVSQQKHLNTLAARQSQTSTPAHLWCCAITGPRAAADPDPWRIQGGGFVTRQISKRTVVCHTLAFTSLDCLHVLTAALTSGIIQRSDFALELFDLFNIITYLNDEFKRHTAFFSPRDCGECSVLLSLPWPSEFL